MTGEANHGPEHAHLLFNTAHMSGVQPVESVASSVDPRLTRYSTISELFGLGEAAAV